MKTTSYIIIGLLGLGAVGAFGIGAYVGNAGGGIPVSKAMRVAGEFTNTPTGRFAVLDTEVKIFCDTLRMDLCNDLIINVSEDASLESPSIGMNSDWGKYLTVRESGDSLILDFDFHEYASGRTFTSERTTDNPTVLLEPFVPTDITINVPKGMLRKVNPDQFVRFIFNGVDADSLELGLLTSMRFDGCRIGSLSFAGDIRTGFDDYSYSRPEAELWFEKSQVGVLTLDVPVGTVGIAGEGSMIEKLVWNDASTKDGQTAFLNAPKGTFREFEWNSPTYENTLQYQLDLNAKGKFSITD